MRIVILSNYESLGSVIIPLTARPARGYGSKSDNEAEGREGNLT